MHDIHGSQDHVCQRRRKGDSPIADDPQDIFQWVHQVTDDGEPHGIRGALQRMNVSKELQDEVLIARIALQLKQRCLNGVQALTRFGPEE